MSDAQPPILGIVGIAVSAVRRDFFGAGEAPDWAWHQWLDVPLLFLQRTETGTEIVWPPHFATIEGAFVPSGE